MANTVTFTIDSKDLNTEYTFVGDSIDLPEGAITIDSSVNYEINSDVDDSFYTFNTNTAPYDVSVTYSGFTITTEDE